MPELCYDSLCHIARFTRGDRLWWSKDIATKTFFVKYQTPCCARAVCKSWHCAFDDMTKHDLKVEHHFPCYLVHGKECNRMVFVTAPLPSFYIKIRSTEYHEAYFDNDVTIMSVLKKICQLTIRDNAGSMTAVKENKLAIQETKEDEETGPFFFTRLSVST